MNLKRLFINDFLRNLNVVETLKDEVDLSNPDLTDAKKQMYWAMLSACLCYEWIKKFNSEIEQKLLLEVGIDFNGLYETLLKDRNSFILNYQIVRDFKRKVGDLKQFVEKLIQ